MQKLTPILCFFFFGFFMNANAQDALDKEISVIINDLVTKMNTKGGIKNVAISDFTKLDGTPTELGKYLAEQFSDAMVNANANFSIIDRARLNFLLKEAGLDARGLLDPSSAAKLGKLKGVDAIVVGTMTSEGEVLRINVRALNLESAVVQASAKGIIRRTPAIIALEEKGLGEVPASTPVKVAVDPKPPVITIKPEATFEHPPLLFECLECKQSGALVTCKLRITSNGKDLKLGVYANKESKIIDGEGNDYFMSALRLGNVSGQGYHEKDFARDVPTSSEFVFSDVNSKINLISKMDVRGWDQKTYVNITLRNIPVKH
ncbi:MAG: hypothetical protein JNN28_11585 [Saprospiraceae bacterium]|nr:hypothetical protein [Saprospiraceae bacterium]